MYMSSFNDKQPQAAIDLNRFASIVADKPSTLVSDKYRFIPTTQALAVLADYGWMPVQAKQAGTRIIEKQGFQKHALRLINANMNRELVVGSTIPQLMLTNSHAGTSAFELSLALFEKVCSNGLCVAKSSQDYLKVAHRGYDDGQLASAVEDVVRGISGVMAKTEAFKGITLSEPERIAFAETAIEMRFDGEVYRVEPRELLRTWRREEQAPTLWNTFNIVQEHTIKGGVRQLRGDGTRIRSRLVKSIDEDIKLNRALWTLTEKMAALKA